MPPNQGELINVNADLFPPKTIILVANSDDPRIKPLIGKIFQTLFAEEGGLLANPAIGNGLDAVYFCFGQTDFTIGPAGNFSFAPLNSCSRVFDSGASPGQEITGLADFCPDQAFLRNIIALSTTSPAVCSSTPIVSNLQPIPIVGTGAAQSQPIAAETAQPSWNEMFEKGTVFVVEQTDNPIYSQYQGIVFRSINATQTGVLAVAQVGTNVPDTVWLPFDGQTTFTVNPAGTFTFPNLEADDRVYNIETMTYMPVLDFCPMFFSDYYFAPIYW